MTLGSETAAVLMRAMVTLNHQTSPAQQSHLTLDERKSVLHQLTVAFETAAKLADVAHLQAVALVAQCNASAAGAERVGTEAAVTEMAGSRGEVVNLVAEREGAKGDVGVVCGGEGTETAGTETAGSKEELEDLVEEGERAKAEVGAVCGETEGQIVKGSPAVVEASSLPPESPGVTSSSTIPIQNPPGTSSSPPLPQPHMIPKPVTEATIIRLYTGKRGWRRLGNTQTRMLGWV